MVAAGASAANSTDGLGIRLVTDTGYFRHYRQANGLSEPPILGALLNLMHYHHEAYKFHSGLTDRHVYQSWPWQWLLLGRPVRSTGPATAAAARPAARRRSCCWVRRSCGGRSSRRWARWSGSASPGATGGRSRSAPAGGGHLPWFYYAVADGRTMFSFYVLPAAAVPDPGRGLRAGRDHDTGGGCGGGEARTDRQLIGTIVAGMYVLIVALCFAYFYPIFVGQLIPYQAWQSRMWLGSRWI